MDGLRERVRARAGAMLVGALLTSLLIGIPLSSASAEDEFYFSAEGGLALTGHGYGHGRGLSQYGAQGQALQGRSVADILSFYYPGLTRSAISESLKVKLDSNGVTPSLLAAASPSGALRVVDEATGESWPLTDPFFRITRLTSGVQLLQATDNATYTRDVATLTGRGRFEATTGTVQLHYPNGTVTRYRGVISAVPSGANLVAVNTVALEQYLWGVVAREMPASWQPAALQAQSVAARTYAAYYKRVRAVSPEWDICDTTSCQVYGGATAEVASTTAAVNATAQWILTYNGAPAATEFSSSNGGYSVGGAAYIVARPDPYDDFPGNPVHTWSIGVTTTSLARAYPSIGTPRSIRILARDGLGEWGGRVTSIAVRGSAGSVTVTGEQFRFATGIRSSWFTPTITGILARWYAAGGTASMGNQTSGEYAVPGGRAQNFERGRIYWTPQYGARIVRAAVADRYLRAGAHTSIGLPVNEEQVIPGGTVQVFQSGRIYWTPQHGAQIVRGAVGHRYAVAGAHLSIGLPTSEEQIIPGGTVQTFQSGRIYWTPQSGPQIVRGTVGYRYAAAGAHLSIGLPLNEEQVIPGGTVQTFQGGRIYWTPQYGAQIVRGTVGLRYSAVGAHATLGLPLNEEQVIAGGTVQTFALGRIYWSPQYGARILTGPVLERYLTEGAQDSRLGMPMSDVVESATGNQAQFVGGMVAWNRSTGQTSVTYR